MNPPIFECFGHFATSELDDGCIVYRAADTYLPVSRLVQMVRAELPGLPVFDEVLLGRLMQTAKEGRSVSQLISGSSAIAAHLTLSEGIFFFYSSMESCAWRRRKWKPTTVCERERSALKGPVDRDRVLECLSNTSSSASLGRKDSCKRWWLAPNHLLQVFRIASALDSDL